MQPVIVHVDDERANLDLFRRTFDEEFRVLTAESGPAALQLFEAPTDIGVLLSDQRMRPMTGIELLSQVAARWPLVTRVLSRWSEPFKSALPRDDAGRFLARFGFRLRALAAAETLRETYLAPSGRERLTLARGEVIVLAESAPR